MTAAAAVLFAVAKELADEAKAAMPKLRDNESVQREWLENGIFYRETSCCGEKFIYRFDFKQRKSRLTAVGGDCNE